MRGSAAPLAMVNVDFSPALVLGLGMVAGGLLLYNVRLSRPYISRDYDVVISSISILVGGILVFQVQSPLMCLAICVVLADVLCFQNTKSLQCYVGDGRAGGWTRCCFLANC